MKDREEKLASFFGALLYGRRVMGSRVVCRQRQSTNVCGVEFRNYGCSSNEFQQLPYATVACAIGMQREEIDKFLFQLGKAYEEICKVLKRQAGGPAG